MNPTKTGRTKTILIICLFCGLTALLSCRHHSLTDDEALMLYDGQPIYPKDLPARLQKRLYVVQNKAYQETLGILQEYALERYQQEHPHFQLSNEDQISITEEEVKKFYDQNKALIPYSYSHAQKEIMKLLKKKKILEKKQQILKQIDQEKQISLLIKQPQLRKDIIKTSQYPTLGPTNTPHILVEYGDFTCPFCQKIAHDIKKLVNKNKGKIRFVFKYFFSHKNKFAIHLAQMAQCAHQQKKFWPFYDYVFSNPQQAIFTPADRIASTLQLNKEPFISCLSNPQTKDEVHASHEEALELGVDQTPSFFIDGQFVSAGTDLTVLQNKINSL